MLRHDYARNYPEITIIRTGPGVWSVQCNRCEDILDEDLDGLAIWLEELSRFFETHDCKPED